MQTGLTLMQEAIVMSKLSPCLKRQVGCLLQLRSGHIIKAYNTPTVACKKCARAGRKSGKGLDKCPAIHAEIACIALAAKAGLSTYGAHLFTSSIIPCKDCMLALKWAGIYIIYVNEYKEYDKLSLKVKGNILIMEIGETQDVR